MAIRKRACDEPGLQEQIVGFARGRARQQLSELTGHYNCWEVYLTAPAEWLDAEFVITGITMGVTCELARVLGRDILHPFVTSAGVFSGKLSGNYGRFFDKVNVHALRISAGTDAFPKCKLQMRGWCQGATAADRNGPEIVQPFGTQGSVWDAQLPGVNVGNTIFRTTAAGRRDNITGIVLTNDDADEQLVQIIRRGIAPGGLGTFNPVASFIMGGAGSHSTVWALSKPLRGFLSSAAALATWEITLTGNAGVRGHAMSVTGYTE